MRRSSVVLVLFLLLSGCATEAVDDAGDDAPAATSATTTAAPSTSTTTTVESPTTVGPTSTSTSPTTTAEPEPDRSQWQRIEPAEEGLPGGVAEIVVLESVLIAVGASEGDDGSYDAGVWTSVDGYRWAGVDDVQAMFGGPGDQVLNGVAAGPLGVVAAGFDTGTSGEWDPGVWFSPDGQSWSRVLGPVSDSEALVEGGLISGVVATDRGFVAVGVAMYEGLQNFAAWTSPDGTAWTKVALGEDLAAAPDSQAANAVAVGENGLVAVGYEAREFGPGILPQFSVAVWVSPDGSAWSRVPHDEEIFTGSGFQGAETVAIAGGEVFALGYTENPGYYDVGIWGSLDGGDWVRIAADDPVLGGLGDQVVRDVAVAEWGFVAVGRDGAAGDDEGAIWISTDGRAWTQLEDDVFGGPGPQEMRGVAVFGDQIVAVGTDRAMGPPTPVVWVGPVPDELLSR